MIAGRWGFYEINCDQRYFVLMRDDAMPHLPWQLYEGAEPLQRFATKKSAIKQIVDGWI
jgi:hypothetical protein